MLVAQGCNFLGASAQFGAETLDDFVALAVPTTGLRLAGDLLGVCEGGKAGQLSAVPNAPVGRTSVLACAVVSQSIIVASPGVKSRGHVPQAKLVRHRLIGRCKNAFED